MNCLDGWEFPPFQQEIADRLLPKSITVFHGLLDEQKLSRLEKKILDAMDSPSGDFLDWEMIESWAKDIVSSLTFIDGH